MHSWLAPFIIGICISTACASPIHTPVKSLVARGHCPDTPRVPMHPPSGQQLKVVSGIQSAPSSLEPSWIFLETTGPERLYTFPQVKLLNSVGESLCRYLVTYRSDSKIALVPRNERGVDMLTKERDAYDKACSHILLSLPLRPSWLTSSWWNHLWLSSVTCSSSIATS